ncbi:N-acetylmuramoyl-L-alanine amidase [Anaeromicropila populeti]|uniref:N-acetylmuramoyl-L-alanine amidase n=1 Tax=Anaeromicropila populeti TaxID=37658 RepID=A0A1I6L1G3_9FIRM|nr:N-acetylmuramoyl-L-alanine amidase [Anaeromicropila populeti]SFR97304.1 N-acetylmuramoyl-L-alanine amidase [Anaeromicropila populeti]
MNRKKSICLYLLLLIVIFIPLQQVNAASSLKIKYDGKMCYYSDKQLKATLDGSTINISKTPGILINGYAMLPYIDVFKKALGASCKYDAGKGTITIKQYNTTIILNIGSRTAYINGKKVLAPVASKKVYYYKTKITRVLVPSRFVAEALGYSYTWNSKTATVQIASPYQIYYDGQWRLYEGSKGTVVFDGESIDVSDMPVIILNSTALVPAKKVFSNSSLNLSYKNNTTANIITISNETTTIQYELGSLTAYVNDIPYTLTEAPKKVKDNVTKKSYVMVPAKFTAQSLGYTYLWDTTDKTCEITSQQEIPEAETAVWQWKSDSTELTDSSVYSNLLLSMTLSRENSQEVFTLEGINPIQANFNFNQDTNSISLSIVNLDNSFEAIDTVMDQSVCIKKLVVSKCENGSTKVSIELLSGTDYYISASGNAYTLNFSNSSASAVSTLELAKPENMDFNLITDEDQYYDKRFLIKIPGNQVAFYQEHEIINTSPQINNISYEYNVEDNVTNIIFATNSVQGYRLKNNTDSFLLEVAEPKYIYNNIVVFDPGHGGDDPGAIQNGYYESNLNFAILYTYLEQYMNLDESNVKAYWTRREESEFLSLSERAAFAEQVDADLFISLHMNAASSSTASGTEIYYSTLNNTTNSFGVTSKLLADYLIETLPNNLGLKSRGVKTANYVVVKSNSVPAVLIELGFMTNSGDLSKLTDSSFQDTVALELYQEINSFFELYPTNR